MTFFEKTPSFNTQPMKDFQVVKEVLCPITHTIMRDPVRAADGLVYEKEAIQDWINTCKRYHKSIISPLTRQPLKNTELVPAQNVKNFIESLRAMIGTNQNASQLIEAFREEQAELAASSSSPTPRPKA